MTRSVREAGFTLLEMLVALVLFSLILSGFAAMFLTLQRTSSSLSRVETSQNVDIVRRFLQQSLEQIRPYTIRQPNGLTKLHFVGQPDHLMFTEVVPGNRDVGGVYQTEIFLDQDRLLFLRRPLGWGGNKKVEPEVLFKNVADLAFSYSPCPSGSQKPTSTRWTMPDQLPFRIDMVVTFPPGDHRQSLRLSSFLAGSTC